MTTLEVGQNNLSTVNYQKLFKAVATELKKEPKLFSIKQDSIVVDFDNVADQVARQFEKSSDYPFENKDGTTYASTYLPTTQENDDFRDQLENLIIATFRTRLEEALRHANVGSSTIKDYANSLPTPLQNLSVNKFSQQTKTGLQYPLNTPFTFQKQRLHATAQPQGKDPWLKGHKLTIRVNNIRNLDQQLINGICTYLQQEGATEDDIEEVREALQIMAEKDNSDFAQVRKILVNLSLARVHRTAKVRYLEYLYTAMRLRKLTDKRKLTGIDLLRCLINRLRAISDYVQQHGDDYYSVTYRGTKMNLRDLFSRADAFDALPIITEIEGMLTESTDYLQGSKTFVQGIKLKLNGAVQVHGGNGKPSFSYHTVLLNPGSKEFQQREAEADVKMYFHERILRVALLYYFVFKNMDNVSYQPAADFEREVLSILREKTDEEKDDALRQLYKDITATTSSNLDLLRYTLVDFLDQPSIGPKQPEKDLLLTLNGEVLEKDVANMLTLHIFFKKSIYTNDGKDALKYVNIGEATIGQSALCKLPIHLSFDPIYYYENNEVRESFTMIHETDGVQFLPIFLTPRDNISALNEYAKAFQHNHRIVLSYRHRPSVIADSERAFAYRFTYQLLAYILLKLLADSIDIDDKRKLFLPIVCLHTAEKSTDSQGQKYDDETFMHSLSKVLAHMLAEDFSSSSQGFHLNTIQARDNEDYYKLQSALYSLYSTLPRIFTLSQSSQASPAQAHPLQKLAIIVISSRKCDNNNKTPDAYKATVYGEVIGVEWLSDGRVRVGTRSTFSDNQLSQLLYEQPNALLAQVKACYADGYRHFLYVAHAPYSRTLDISDKNKTRDLFFMRQEVIQAMREVGSGIKVYPVFCDMYYVVNQQRAKKKALAVDSLYVDDLGELAQLSTDPSRRALIFLNLFSGAVVSKQPIYNGVMSYSTLVNVYENDTTYSQYIWNDLLSENLPNSFKSDLVNFVTLLHFSRYEKPRDFGFKLDPYKRTIGDMSIGKIAVFTHMKSRVRFNMLAFLTLVRAVLRREL